MSTITNNWIWRDGGSYFGVPVEKFLGWYLTVICVSCRSLRCMPGRLSATPEPHSRLLGEALARLFLDRDCTSPRPDAQFHIGGRLGRDPGTRGK